MLICRDVTELTTDYLDGSLPLQRRLAVRFHLAICSLCRRHMRQVRQTLALLRILPPEPVSTAIEDRLVARAQANHGAPPPPSPHPRPG